MTKILIDEAVVRHALDTLEVVWKDHQAITALRQALADAALDKKADNARELGLSYDASVVRIDTSAERVEKAAGNKHIPTPPECKTEAEKTAFAFGWFKALESVREQPAPAQPLTDEEIDRVTDAQWAKGANKPIYAAHRAYARAIEAKLKEKNT